MQHVTFTILGVSVRTDHSRLRKQAAAEAELAKFPSPLRFHHIKVYPVTAYKHSASYGLFRACVQYALASANHIPVRW
jgi:hypothetical protein